MDGNSGYDKKWLEMAGNGWKWLELPDMAGNGWKLIDMVRIAKNCCK